MEVNRCTVWYPSLRLTWKTLCGIRKGNIMSGSWIWLARQNLRQGLRPWVAFAALSLPLSIFWSLHSLSTSFYTFPPIRPCFCRHSSPFLLVSLLHTAPSEYNCSYCASASKIACSRLKFHSYKRDIVAVPQGNWQRDWAAACCWILPRQIAKAKIHFQLKAGQALLAHCVILIGFPIFFFFFAFVNRVNIPERSLWVKWPICRQKAVREWLIWAWRGMDRPWRHDK